MRRTISNEFKNKIKSMDKEELIDFVQKLNRELDTKKEEAKKLVIEARKKDFNTNIAPYNALRRRERETANRKMRAYHSKEIEPLMEKIVHAKVLLMEKFGVTND